MNTGFGVAGIVSPIVFGFLIDQTGNWQLPFALSVLFCADRHPAVPTSRPTSPGPRADAVHPQLIASRP